ncbi:ATP-binding protein [Alcanivorax sp.]|uniref:ATP-binding protein n=1 Tax=Alcanivorax sp. TaxID=1872427 RepID=UPI0032D952F1
MTSMGRRLGLSLFVSLLLAGVLISQGALWWLERDQRQALSLQLRDDAAGVLAALVTGPQGRLMLDTSRLHPAYRRPLSGRYFVVLLGDQRWRSRSLWDQQLTLPVAPGVHPVLQAGASDQQLLRFRGEYEKEDQAVTVVVAQDYTPILTTYNQTRTVVLLVWVGVLLLLAAVQQWLLRRGLAPLRQARKEIEQLRGGKRHELNEAVAQELHPLVVEINRLQRHTEQQLQRSRHALGDLGHALKTPLAILKNRCTQELQDSDPALYAMLSEQLAHMEGNIRRALGRARVAAGVTASNPLRPLVDIPLLLKTLEQAHQRDLAVQLVMPELSAQPFDRDDMLEVLGNVLDNAFKWADSRIALTVDVETGNDRRRLTVCVDDDGPGIQADRYAQVVQRGQRLDERAAGHGLGLSIVSDTVVAYEGTLVLEASSWGGLRVLLSFPYPS